MSLRDELFGAIFGKRLLSNREPATVLELANGVMRVQVANLVTNIQYSGPETLAPGTGVWVQRNPDDPMGSYTYLGGRGGPYSPGINPAAVSGGTGSLDSLEARIAALEARPLAPQILSEDGVAMPRRRRFMFTGLFALVVDDAANDRTILYASYEGSLGGSPYDTSPPYDDPGATYDDPLVKYDGAVVTYDDPAVPYDGVAY